MSSTTGVLFLGGPLHGQRLDVGDRQVWIATTRTPEIVDYASAARQGKPHAMRDESFTLSYERRRFAFFRAEKTVSIFAPVGWSDLDRDYAVARWIETGS